MYEKRWYLHVGFELQFTWVHSTSKFRTENSGSYKRVSTVVWLTKTKSSLQWISGCLCLQINLLPFGLKILQTSHSSKFSIAFCTTFKAFWYVMAMLFFSEKIERVKNILNSWSARRLTLLGKITIIKALAVSQIVHVLTSLPTHQGALKEINTLLYDFLWESKGDKIKRTNVQWLR